MISDRYRDFYVRDEEKRCENSMEIFGIFPTIAAFVVPIKINRMSDEIT